MNLHTFLLVAAIALIAGLARRRQLATSST
jgi:hypothetical protein